MFGNLSLRSLLKIPTTTESFNVVGKRFKLKPKSRFRSTHQLVNMEGGGGRGNRSISSIPNVIKIQQLIHNNDATGGGGGLEEDAFNKLRKIINSDPTDGWDKCWQQELTPWDLGGPTPIILNLLQMNALPKGRVLVPGCGGGHDVVAMAGPEREVVGLDFSEIAIKKARELFSSSQKANYFDFIKEDFFTWNSPRLFDLIFDYTFFCAIEPSVRPAWAKRILDLLKPDGELITLMFPIDDHIGGPPYKVSLEEYEEVLHPMGFEAVSVTDNELAISARKGKEKLGRWKRCSNQSHL